ncbi:MAG: hypothetical protein ACJAY2_002751 [Pseudomonadales bacterium]|jgi:hypothetical protein
MTHLGARVRVEAHHRNPFLLLVYISFDRIYKVGCHDNAIEINLRTNANIAGRVFLICRSDLV